MEVSAEEFSHKVAVDGFSLACDDRAQDCESYMSSSGEMKMSLKLITFGASACSFACIVVHPYILMTQMFEKLQFSVGAFRQDRGAERFHYFLDGDSLTGELIFRRAIEKS